MNDDEMMRATYYQAQINVLHELAMLARAGIFLDAEALDAKASAIEAALQAMDGPAVMV